MKRLLGKFAIVTGGSSGIGAACAETLAEDGAGVIACARRFAAAPAKHPALGEVVHQHLDVTDEAEVDARFAEAPALDIVVLAAGAATFAPIERATVAELRAMLEVHVVGTLTCARAALRRMQPRRQGHIMILGSHAAHAAFVECGSYTAAKAGQLGLARVLAAEARPHGIRVTALLAGATDTPLWDQRPGFDRDQMMKPDDVARFVVSIVAQPEIAVDEVIVRPPSGVL